MKVSISESSSVESKWISHVSRSLYNNSPKLHYFLQYLLSQILMNELLSININVKIFYCILLYDLMHSGHNFVILFWVYNAAWCFLLSSELDLSDHSLNCMLICFGMMDDSECLWQEQSQLLTIRLNRHMIYNLVVMDTEADEDSL